MINYSRIRVFACSIQPTVSRSDQRKIKSYDDNLLGCISDIVSDLRFLISFEINFLE